jgi:hypothetical protein
MKKFRLFKIIFLGAGVAMLVGAGALWLNTRSFIAHATKTTGTVIEMREVRDKDDNSSTYKPVVQFVTGNGVNVTFDSSFSSNPPSYSVGESVEVLYEVGEPNGARINGFGSLWFGPIILGILGAMFTAIGGGIMLAGRLGDRKKSYLLAYGNAVQTDFQSVERNTSLKVNGKSPWRVVSQWQNPETGKLRVFNSENLWFDPAKFVNTKQITVLLDPKDPKRYHMDLSFLPQVEGD